MPSPGPATTPPPLLPVFRVFLASPNDVPQERAIVREVLAALRAEAHIRDHLSLAEPITWDRPDGGPAVPLPATLQPQQAIEQGLPGPADCELFIGVFWGRIGSPDPVPARKPDGSAYVSGTEYEYCQALAGHQARGRPEVWLFRRRDEPKYGFSDPKRAAAETQWRLLEAFFAPLRGADGSYRGGIHRYQDPADFRAQLTGLLRDHLTGVIAGLSAVALAQPTPPANPDQPPAAHLATLAAGLDPTLDLPVPPVRFTGEPYPGLDAFKPEQSPVFFGRGLELDRLLGLFTDPANRFIAVVGDSGTGKSSLVAAGLLPRLRAGLIGGAPWADLRLTPGERGADPFLAVALAWQAKAEATGLPRETCAPRELAVDLRQDPAQLIRRLHRLLADSPDGGECLLFLDQFEELFTLVAAERQAPFVALLAAVAQSPRLRVLVTLRVDFYPAVAACAGLADLLQPPGRSFPLIPPGAAALTLMIVGPARAAGLDLDDELVAAILDEERESGGGPGALPLVAFVLRALWERGRADGRLTLAHYTALGGLTGAVAQRVGATLQRRGSAEQAALPRLFEQLVRVDDREVATRRRARTARLDPDAQALAAALTDARLLTASQGADGEATVELAHEVLLKAWPDLARWVTDATDGLRARRDLERAAAEWQAAGRGGDGLKGGAQLKRYLGAPVSADPLVAVYLRACKRRRLGRRLGLTAAGLVLGFAGWLYGHLSHSSYPPGEALWAWLVDHRVAPLQEPVMVPIPAGRFQMGDVAGDGVDDDELPMHEVQVAAFAIGAYEVTFAEYDLFAAATGRARPPDQGWGRGEWPVINITWKDARDYATWMARRSGKGYRLPSEAEWEYAARAGSSAGQWWRETISPDAEPCLYANAQDQTLAGSQRLSGGVENLRRGGFWQPFECTDAFDGTAPVGSFAPNGWGLYDTLGNVWEWCADWYGDYPVGPVTNPVGPVKGPGHVLRGGAWYSLGRNLRSAARMMGAPDARGDGLGLRLARSDVIVHTPSLKNNGLGDFCPALCEDIAPRVGAS